MRFCPTVRLTAVDALGPLNGRITTGKDGRRHFTLYAGAYATDLGDPDRRPAWTADLHFKSAEPAATTTYWDYLNRRTASVMAGRARKAANATLVATLPDHSVRPFLAHVLSTPEAFVGIWFFEVSVKIPARHTLPLQKTADGSSAFELRMQRRAAAGRGAGLGGHVGCQSCAAAALAGSRRQDLSALLPDPVNGAMASALWPRNLVALCDCQKTVRSE
jgi:hypothetical protein